jgi:hypothetical protein
MEVKITRAELHAALTHFYTEFKDHPENFEGYGTPEEDAEVVTNAIFEYINNQGA